eukprot:TRINITY_DN5063_c0_g2_i2.p1 TRINITY_DN5063_c0_g2~~TRINITY_DN5063_c0_g2_i2.p1  ORF type:complete len:135 (-),score=13.50 TRINITY_DN5063_c0_g2_i2:159-563(-)
MSLHAALKFRLLAMRATPMARSDATVVYAAAACFLLWQPAGAAVERVLRATGHRENFKCVIFNCGPARTLAGCVFAAWRAAGWRVLLLIMDAGEGGAAWCCAWRAAMAAASVSVTGGALCTVDDAGVEFGLDRV